MEEQLVTLTYAQALSVVAELVLVETVNVLQIMSTSTTLVKKHVFHRRARLGYISMN